MDPTGRSPWVVLGVDEHATLAEVQHAFRIKAKQTHPDHGGDRRAFEPVRAAYEAVRHLAPRTVQLRPNPYAWCDEPVPAAAPFVRPVHPRPRPSAVRFAEVLETELRKVRVASAA